MARDVYRKLFKEFGNQVFKNISEAEERHLERMGDMIKRYGLTDKDPVDDEDDDADAGVFKDEGLQEFYDEMVSAKTELQALRNGAYVEEVDIRDLEDAIEDTDEECLAAVYGNLLRASNNHLDAFSRNIEALTGESYEKQLDD